MVKKLKEQGLFDPSMIASNEKVKDPVEEIVPTQKKEEEEPQNPMT